MDIAKIRKKKRQAGDKENSGKALPGTEETNNLKPPAERQALTQEEDKGTVKETTFQTAFGSSGLDTLNKNFEKETPSISELIKTPIDTGRVTPEQASSEVKLEEEIDLLVFKLGSEEYSFRLEDVREILKKQFITNVPLSPFSVIGITSLRGTVIPVIDLSLKLLGIPSRNERRNRILIMEGIKGTIGCMVDEVEGVVRCSLEQMRGLPENMTEKEKAFMEAIFVVDNRFITLLKRDIIELKGKEA